MSDRRVAVSRRRARSRMTGLVLGGALAFLFGGPAGLLTFLFVAVIAAVFLLATDR